MLRLSDILGQTAALDTLRRAYAAGRLPHGMIFGGPVGVGKATTARALGALFLCEKPKGDEPCGRCSSCTIFDTGNHPDFHVITKELIRYHDKTGTSKGINLSIDVIRPELIAPAGRKPSLNVGKVFIVEQADLMTAQAQNAMLKTLEEPYGRTLIILLTDQPDSLLQTIRSRCQLVRFAALDEKTVRQQLEKRGIDQEQASEAARFAEGSLGLALKWLEDGVIDAARELTGQIEQLLAGRAPDDLPAWYRKSADAYAARQLERDSLSSKDQATREGLDLYLHLTANTLRRHLRQTTDADALDRLCAALDALTQAQTYLDANVNVSLIFQQLSMALESQFLPNGTRQQ